MATFEAPIVVRFDNNMVFDAMFRDKWERAVDRAWHTMMKPRRTIWQRFTSWIDLHFSLIPPSAENTGK